VSTQQACRLETYTYTRSRSIYGEDHPNIVGAASLLSLIQWSLGDYAQARQLADDSLARSRRIHGDDHP
jgi:hypothetical protein